MRFVEIVHVGRVGLVARIAALTCVVGLLSGCPKKDGDAAPEPPATPATTSDKAGADPAPVAPAAAPAPKKKDDDKGGW